MTPEDRVEDTGIRDTRPTVNAVDILEAARTKALEESRQKKIEIVAGAICKRDNMYDELKKLEKEAEKLRKSIRRTDEMLKELESGNNDVLSRIGNDQNKGQ